MQLPSNETDRLTALHSRAILDTPPEPSFDRITRLAAQFFAASVAVVSFVDRDRCWFKSRHAFPLTEISREGSFCAHTIQGSDLLLVPDTAADHRFAGLSIVAGPPGIRFYAGVPLIAPGGFAVGTLAVMDTHAHPPLSEPQRTALRDFGALVEEEFRRRSDAVAHSSGRPSLEDIENALPAIVWTSDSRGQTTFATRLWDEFSGGSPAHPVNWIEAVHPDDRAHALAATRAGIEARAGFDFECRFRRADGEYRWMIDWARPRFHPDGAFSGLIGICVDITARKQALEALHESEERFRIAAENATDVIYEWDVRTDRVTVLGTYLSRLGYNQDEIPRCFDDRLRSVHPEDRDRFSMAVDRMLADGVPFREEYRTVRHDGAVHHWIGRASLIRGAEGVPRKVVGVMEDITERKRAEETQARLAAIVQCSHDAIISATLDGHNLTWNPGAEKLLGYSADEVRGRSIDLVVPPDRTEEVADIFRRVLRGETILSHETVRVRKDGSRVPVSLSISAIENPDGQPIAVSAIVRDLSALKEAEAARRASEEWLRLAQDAVGLGIWDFNPREGVSTGSEQYYRLLGLPPRESPMPLAEWLSMIHPDDRGRIRTVDEKVLREKDQIADEFRVIRPDGSVRWLISKIKIQHDSAGQPVRVIGLSLDITDLKEAEQARRELERRYENLFRTIAQGVVYLGAEGEIISANPAAEKILGLTIEEVRGLRRSSLNLSEVREDGARLPPEDSPTLLALRTGSVIHGVVAGIRHARTQERHWVSIDAFPQFRPGDARPCECLTVFQDITGLVNAQAALRASEDRFRGLIEHGLEIIGVLNTDATLRYLSPSVECVLGYAPEVLTGANVQQYLHPDDLPLLDGATNTLRLPGRTVTRDLRIRHRDGSWPLMEVVATNLLHIDALKGIVFHARDITEKRRFEQDLVESRDQLRQMAARVESVREQERIYISREIHDQLGQTLSALKFDLEGLALKYRPRDAARRKEFSSRIADMVQHIGTAIGNVRRICSELRPSVLDHLGLSAAIQWQLTEFESHNGIQCRSTGLPEDLPLGSEQSIAVFRIFQEILTNVARHARATVVNVEADIDSGWFTLRVSDNGKGLNVNRLSDPNSLGLLGMRERALEFGGSVEFSARRGVGATVTLRLPTSPSVNRRKDSANPCA